MDAIQYLGALRRRWPIVVSAIILSLTAGFLVNSRVSSNPAPTGGGPAATSYTSTALLLNTSSGSGVAGMASFDNTTLSRLAIVGEIPERVADRLNYDGNPLELAARVSIVPAEGSGLMEVTSVSEDPRQAKRISNAFAQEMVAWLEDNQESIATTAAAAVLQELDEVSAEVAELNSQLELNPPDDELLQAERDVKVQFVESLTTYYQQLITAATAPSGVQVVMGGIPQATPGADYAAELSGPQGRGLRLLLAGFLGLIAGLGIALLLDRVDTRIRSKQQAEEHFGAPVLAEIPHLMRRDRGAIPVAAARPKSQAADAFRLLATSIWKRDPKSSWETRPKTILVTSGGAGEGKSTVVANLAASFAEMGQKVLTVSCDFRRPKLHELLGVAGTPGLADAIQSSNGQPVIGNNILTSSFHDFVGVVPTGTLPDKPGELLSSEAMKRGLSEARQLADVVLLDSSPLHAGDSTLLLDDVDAVVVVARAGHTNASEASHTAGLLARLKAPVRGVVLSDTEDFSFGKNDPDGLFKGFSLLARHPKAS